MFDRVLNTPLYNIAKSPADTGRKVDVKWTYIRSEDFQDLFWTSYVRSIYVLCLRGRVPTWLFPREFPKNDFTERPWAT